MAVCGFLATVNTGSLALGLLAAMGAGGAMAFIHAFMPVTLGVYQVVSGLTLTLFGAGGSDYLRRPVIGVSLPVTFRAVDIPLLYRAKPGLHLL